MRLATKASACFPGNSKTETKAEWIAIDWGTSNVRVWVLGPSITVIGELPSEEGIGRWVVRLSQPEKIVDGNFSVGRLHQLCFSQTNKVVLDQLHGRQAGK